MKMKGQLVFEFIIAAVVFIGIIVFVLNLLNSNVALFTEDYFSQALESKAVAASEAVLKTNGTVGLAKEWPVLSDQALSGFAANCTTDWSEMLKQLDLDAKPSFGTYDMRLEVRTLPAQTLLLECAPGSQVPSGVPVATVKRYALTEAGGSVRATFWVW